MKVYDLKWDNEMSNINIKPLQGELVYLVHPTPCKNGWYQKLRSSETNKPVYVQLTGETEVFNMLNSSILDKNDYKSHTKYRSACIVRGAINVAAFIRSGFTDETRVYNPEIRKLQQSIHDLSVALERKQRRLIELQGFDSIQPTPAVKVVWHPKGFIDGLL